MLFIKLNKTHNIALWKGGWKNQGTIEQWFCERYALQIRFAASGKDMNTHKDLFIIFFLRVTPKSREEYDAAYIINT